MKIYFRGFYIVLEQRHDDWIAYNMLFPEVWESGQTYQEALGKFIMTHAEVINENS